MKYIHIGLGKAGTTFLQNFIFEVISKYEDLIYYNGNHPGSKLVRNHSIKLRTNEEISDIKLPDNVFVSDETLVSWDPQDWEKFAAKNLIAFGKNCTIILTIREPSSYFNSLYSEICLQSSKVKSFDEFIYCKKQIDLKSSPSSININNFSYNKLINIYKKIFNKIIIIKYEDITNLTFIDKYFSKNSINILEEIQYTKTFKINKSYSMYAEAIHLFLFNNISKLIFYLIKLKILKKLILMVARQMIKIHFPYALVKQTLSKLKSIDNIYLTKKATEYLFVYLKIRFIIQKIDYFFPGKINQRIFAMDVNKRIELLNLEYKKIK